MENRAPESGLELVLDNRKLIVAFVLLIAICGCFFILGFVEGKRQGIQETTRNSASVAPASKSDSKDQAGEPGQKAPEDRAAKEQLDWYKSVNSPGEPAKTLVKPPAESAKTTAPSKPAKEAAAKSAPSAAAAATSTPPSSSKTVYSVQVGVFKNRDKVEAVAKLLKSKGYQSYIEPYDSGIYSLRVGRFDSRAEAVALSRRLKADGFAALIKAK